MLCEIGQHSSLVHLEVSELSFHQMQLHTPPEHSSLHNCLVLAEQNVVFHGIIVWTRKTYKRTPVNLASVQRDLSEVCFLVVKI